MGLHDTSRFVVAHGGRRPRVGCRPTRVSCRALGAVAAVSVLAPALALATPVNMGLAGPDRWAMLSLGQTDIHVGSSVVTGVVGNVGVAPPGACNIVKSVISGKLVMNTTGNLSLSDAIIMGGIQQDAAGDNLLLQAAADAVQANQDAAALPATSPLNIVNNATAAIFGAPGLNVYHLQNFELTNGFSLTIDGPPGASFVFNISNTMHMADGSEVILGLGIHPSQVLYNLVGGGKQVDIIKPETTARGVILAPARDVKIDQAKVIGETVSGGGKLVNNSRGAVDGSGCPECPTPMLVTTWGQVKALYR